MRQLHIFSIKPKVDMRLFVDFCVFPCFSLNLPELNLKLLITENRPTLVTPNPSPSYTSSSPLNTEDIV